MPPAGFEPEIPTIKRPQTYALNGMATGTGHCIVWKVKHNVLAKFLLVVGLMATVNWRILKCEVDTELCH
jgi:hypothetical protein